MEKPHIPQQDTQEPKKPLQANQICELFDISKATLFRWEREGVIAPPPRDWRNWRIYKEENVAEISRIIGTRHRKSPAF